MPRDTPVADRVLVDTLNRETWNMTDTTRTVFIALGASLLVVVLVPLLVCLAAFAGGGAGSMGNMGDMMNNTGGMMSRMGGMHWTAGGAALLVLVVGAVLLGMGVKRR